MNNDKEATAWLVIYQSLIAMNHHPGVKNPQSSKALGALTDYYMLELHRRYLCQPSSQAPSSQGAPHSDQEYSAASANTAQTKQT